MNFTLNSSFFKDIIKLKYRKKYVLFSALYGLSSLIIPFGLQFLVNSLSIASIWQNSLTFILILFAGLALSKTVRYSLLLLNENMQRQLIIHNLGVWRHKMPSKMSHYYFEINSITKSFAKIYSSLVDFILITFFGVLTIVVFHPFFLILPVIMLLGTYIILNYWEDGIETSIEESNVKYELHDKVKLREKINLDQLFHFIFTRDVHFNIIRKNSIVIYSIQVLTQVCLISLGVYLIKIDELNVGQFVSAEIILSGILSSFDKIPGILEGVYDYETSIYKVNYALSKKDVK